MHDTFLLKEPKLRVNNEGTKKINLIITEISERSSASQKNAKRILKCMRLIPWTKNLSGRPGTGLSSARYVWVF